MPGTRSTARASCSPASSLSTSADWRNRSASCATRGPRVTSTETDFAAVGRAMKQCEASDCGADSRTLTGFSPWTLAMSAAVRSAQALATPARRSMREGYRREWRGAAWSTGGAVPSRLFECCYVERVGGNGAQRSLAAELRVREERLVPLGDGRDGDEEGLAGGQPELGRRHRAARRPAADLHTPPIEILGGGARRDHEVGDAVGGLPVQRHGARRIDGLRHWASLRVLG